ncbi:hypothetical protein [Balnearium lithotrophicum]|nr:hypothetical protein [Balnearium lithotrophicum]
MRIWKSDFDDGIVTKAFYLYKPLKITPKALYLEVPDERVHELVYSPSGEKASWKDAESWFYYWAEKEDAEELQKFIDDFELRNLMFEAN